MLDEIIDYLGTLQGQVITDVEIIATCQMLRVTFESSVTLELTSGWVYGPDSKVTFGAMDIGFYFGSDEELLQTIEEDEKKHLSKVSSIKGRILAKVKSTKSGITLELSNKKQIRWHLLSAEELGIRLLKNA